MVLFYFKEGQQEENVKFPEMLNNWGLGKEVASGIARFQCLGKIGQAQEGNHSEPTKPWPRLIRFAELDDKWSVFKCRINMKEHFLAWSGADMTHKQREEKKSLLNLRGEETNDIKKRQNSKKNQSLKYESNRGLHCKKCTNIYEWTVSLLHREVNIAILTNLNKHVQIIM